ncbi:MAG TPA: hypothetical protein VFE85_05600 [Woeseiaceae bacterium]|nr:hypothetical protein [Woeseiaceae bacterium]
MQSLDVFQSLWAMERRHPTLAERSAAEHFATIAAAGYTGICLDPSVPEIDDTVRLRPLFERHGLQCMLNIFPATADELRPLLDLAAHMDACLVNIIGGVMPLQVADAVPLAERWIAESREYAFPVLFETHRDSLLNDLYYTLELLQRVPAMRLCADLSHFVVDREMRMPPRDADREYISAILSRSDCLQGRVASREQVQVSIDFPQHREWVEQFKAWWLEGMRDWRHRNADDARLVFLCELGPPPYAITDANGEELSNRWTEAATIRRWAEELWAESGRRPAADIARP